MSPGPRWISTTVSHLAGTPHGRPRFSYVAEDVTERKAAEEALRASEERFDRAVRGSSAGIWDWTCLTDEVYYSPRFKELIGYEDHEFPNALGSFFGRLHPDDQARIRDAFVSHCEQRVPYDVEYRLLTKSGEYRWFHARGQAEWDEDMRPTRMAGSISDVTTRYLAEDALLASEVRLVRSMDRPLTRYLAEDALLASEGRFRAVFDQTFQLTGLMSPAGIMLEINSSAVKFGGLNREEVLGRPFWEISWWDAMPETRERMRAAVVEGAQGRSVGFEVEARGAGDVLASFDFSLRPIRDESGAVVLLVPEGRDITERKRAEKAQARLVAILDATTDFVAIADTSGRAIYLNRGGRRMVGRREEDIPQSVISDYHPAWANEIITTEALPTALREGTWAGELAICGGDGCEVPVSAVILALKDAHGHPEFLSCTYRDISDRKRAEEEIRTLNEGLKRRVEHLSALQSIDAAINSSFDIRQTLDVVINQVFSQLGADAAAVWLCEPGPGSMTCAASRGFTAPAMVRSPLSFDDSMPGRVALDLRPVHLEQLAESFRPFGRAGVVAEEGFVGYSAVPLVSKGKCLGVLEVFQRTPLERPPEWYDFLTAVADQATIAVENTYLFDGLERSNLELTLAYDSTIDGWSKALDLRDKESEGHSQRVTATTLCLARVFGFNDADLLLIRRGALLHDIGKLGVPDAILLKPGPLTDDEWEVMRRHPTYAYDWLSPIEYLRPSLEIPYCHHEKWDGSGYPRGLKGEQIPLAARMFAAVDICDALLSDRPYRKGWPVEKVREHIRSLSGSHLDPHVVAAFLPMINAAGISTPEGPAGGAVVRDAGPGETDPGLLGAAFRALLEHSDDFVVLLDNLGRIRAASRSFVAAFASGRNPRGIDFVGLLDSGSRDKFRTLLKQPLDGSLSLELNHLTESRSLRLVNYAVCELSISPGTRLLTAVGRCQEASLEFVEKLVRMNQDLEEARRALAESAMSDPLTGLGNRRWLFERLEALWAEGHRRGRLPWVMMADLDHFKAVNDTYGHQTGDDVLVAASRAMRESVRTEDLVARYGGEEFVLAGLCDLETDPQGLAVRVIEAIRDLQVECPGGHLRVTASIGVALAKPDPSNPPWIALRAADQALYRAKGGGRDRYEIEPGVLGLRAAPLGLGEVMRKIVPCRNGRAS